MPAAAHEMTPTGVTGHDNLTELASPYRTPASRVDEPPEAGELAVTFPRTVCVTWAILWRVLVAEIALGAAAGFLAPTVLRLFAIPTSTRLLVFVNAFVLMTVPIVWYLAVRSVLRLSWSDFRLGMVPVNWAYPASSTIREITIENASQAILSNIVLIGFGFTVKAGDLTPRQKKTLRVRLRGDSPLTIDFHAGHKDIRRTDVAYLREDDTAPISIEVTDETVGA